MRSVFIFLLVVRVFGADMELFVGKKFISYRSGLFEALTQTAAVYRLQNEGVNEDYAGALKDSFRGVGGLSLSDKTEFVRAGTIGDEWAIVFYGDYGDKQIRQLLEKGGWKREKEFFVRRGQLLRLTDKTMGLASGEGMSDVLRAPEDFLQLPGTDWLRLKKRGVDAAALLQRTPTLVPFLHGLQDVEFCWQGSEVVVNIRMSDPLQAASFVAMASQFMMIAGMLLEEIKLQSVKDADWWQVLDFASFAARRNYLTILSGFLGTVSFGSHADVFSLRCKPGELNEFAGKNLVSVLTYFIFSGAGFSDSGIRQRLQGLLSAQGQVEKSDESGCEVALKMAQQALDFYRQDSGRDVSYEEAEAALFADGYLPESLQCGGLDVRGGGIFVTNDGGKIIVRPQSK